jgi:hypothetical protein
MKLIKIQGFIFPSCITSDKQIFNIYNKLKVKYKFKNIKEGIKFIRDNFDSLNLENIKINEKEKEKEVKIFTNQTNLFIPENTKEYREYLSSEKWLEYSRNIKKVCNKCEICQSSIQLVVHHIKYKNVVGYEYSNRDWLLVVCSNCHYKIHTNKNYYDIDPKRNNKTIKRSTFLNLLRN